MNQLLNKSKEPIKKEIEIFEKKFFNIIKSNISLINKIGDYLFKEKGKLIRPLLILLIAKMLSSSKIKKKTYDTACLIELIHNATLIHDDVVDDSSIRRGTLSIKERWNNKIAVLIGDHLLSKSLLLASNNNYLDLLKIICETIKNMSEGELIQMNNPLNISENIYNKIIYKKTANLIASSCECSAVSVNAKKRDILNMKNFGIFIGIAYQIKDDLFDYNENNNFIDKPIGIDLKEKNITLPLIFTIKNSSSSDKKLILNAINNYNEKNKIKIINFVNKYGGLQYAIKKMMMFYHKALKILNFYPEGTIKDSLKILTKFVIKRNK